MRCLKCVAFGAPLLAVSFPLLFRHGLYPLVKELMAAPRDHDLGKVPVLSADELRAFYSGKRALVVGGTRGVGRGLSLALARAGASVTVVGRSALSGDHILQELRSTMPEGPKQSFRYIQGDLGSVASSRALVDALAGHAQADGRFDYLATTAAVFPDWTAPLQQEDGLDKGFAIAVVGRYVVYEGMHRFMALKEDRSANAGVRVLNVLASGGGLSGLDRDVASGKRNSTNLFENMMTFALGNEVMQMLLDREVLSSNFGTTRVSTHPGALKTELHRGQGWAFDMLEAVMVQLVGISEEECGLRQASILAYPHLRSSSLSYVDDLMQGRRAGGSLSAEFEHHSDWLLQLVRQKLA